MQILKILMLLLKNNLEVPEPTLTKPNLENNEFLVYIDI